jgi:hypothetical protein
VCLLARRVLLTHGEAAHGLERLRTSITLSGTHARKHHDTAGVAP